MNKLVVIGSTGYVGSAIVNELVYRKIDFTAIARDTSKIPTNKLITKINLDVTNEVELAQTVLHAEVVLSAFNPGWNNPNLYSAYLKGATSIHNAVKKAKAKRLIVVGGAGSLYIKPDLQLVDTPDFPIEIKPGALAVRDYFLNVLQPEENFEWTYFSPAIEMNPDNPGKRTGQYRFGLKKPVFDRELRSIISVEDVAVAIVDEIENKQFNHKQFTIGY